MGTRPGQIDPGVVLYLIEQKGMSAARGSEAASISECGLKGLSGISNDVRELEASADPRAAFALDYFCYRVALVHRHAGRGAGRPRRLRVHGRHRRELAQHARAHRRKSSVGWAPRSIRPRMPARAMLLSRAEEPHRALCRSDRRGIDDRAPHPGALVGARRSASCARETGRIITVPVPSSHRVQRYAARL